MILETSPKSWRKSGEKKKIQMEVFSVFRFQRLPTCFFGSKCDMKICQRHSC